MVLRSIRTAGEMLVDAVFPRRCAVCGVDIGARRGRLVCSGCAGRVRQATAQPACLRCGHRVGTFGFDERGRCVACREREMQFDGMARVGPYEGVVRGLFLGFKFGGRDGLDAMIGGLVADAMRQADWFERLDALVVVPTHWRHGLGRPFYAAAVLGGVIRRRTGIPTARVMRRVAAGPHQYELPRSERAENIRGKFSMIRGARVAGARLCLVDDVSTTGATLNECAGVLKQAGASRVYAAVFSKVDTSAHLVDDKTGAV